MFRSVSGGMVARVSIKINFLFSVEIKKKIMFFWKLFPCEEKNTFACINIDWFKSKIDMYFGDFCIHRDTQTILTIQNNTITKNHRISVTHTENRIWQLRIRDVKVDDQGWYMVN